MMGDHVTFMMGEFAALFPTDRWYARNHMWAKPSEPQSTESQSSGANHRFGFTAYAVRLLQDVYFLDWAVDAPINVTDGMEIGTIESKKAESSLYAPTIGTLLHFNEQLMDDPSAINVDKYENGWLFEMQCDTNEFLNPQQYIQYLDSVWEKTQRTIKGQMNQ
jgi:glycine cleavage system H protein